MAYDILQVNFYIYIKTKLKKYSFVMAWASEGVSCAFGRPSEGGRVGTKV